MLHTQTTADLARQIQRERLRTSQILWELQRTLAGNSKPASSTLWQRVKALLKPSRPQYRRDF